VPPHLVTLLSASEGASALGAAARAAGLEWIWLGLPNAQRPEPPLRDEIAGGLTSPAPSSMGSP
jgi:hypothetical protein